MAREIAIQWSHRGLNVIVAAPDASAQSGLKVSNAFWVDLPAEKESEKDVAAEVAAALKRNGIGRCDVTLVLDRDCVEVRKFDVPPVPADELPDLVRMQAPTLFTAFNEDWSLDYVPVKHNSDGIPVSVIAVAVSPQLLEQVKSSLEGAGLKLKSITVRGLAILELAAASGLNTGRRLVLYRADDDLDFTVANGKDLVLSRSVKLPTGYDQAEVAKRVVQEFKRTQGALGQITENFKLDHLAIVGNAADFQNLGEALKQWFANDPVHMDPSRAGGWSDGMISSVGENRVPGFAPAMGAVAAKLAGRKLAVDVLNPRSRPKTKGNRQKLYLMAGLAAAIVLCAFGTAWVVLDGQQKQISSLQQELQQLKEVTDGSDQLVGPVELIDSWKKADINWLNQLATLSEKAPLPDDLTISLFAASYLENKDEISINARGMISDQGMHSEFRTDLLEKYEVDSKQLDVLAEASKLRIGDELFYTRKFDEVLTIPLEDIEWDLDQYPVESNKPAIGDGVEGGQPADEAVGDESKAE